MNIENNDRYNYHLNQLLNYLSKYNPIYIN